MTDVNFLRNVSNINNNLQTGTESRLNRQDKKQCFKDIFNEKYNTDDISFSKHANVRIAERNIDIDNEITQKLSEAVSQAKDKGLKNVLVMIDNSAFIVSTINNKVITAVNNKELKENIFTNIDGAVIK